MSTLTPAQKVAAYIKFRDYKKAAEDEFKKSMSKVVQAMDKLEAELLDTLNQSGANSLSCDEGTVYRNMQLSATVENRDDFLGHVRNTGLWEALDVKANKTFIKEYMEANGTVPPGLKVTQMATVGVRRS